MKRILGLDIGGSATRWHLRETDKAPLSGHARGFSGHVFRPEIRAQAMAALSAIHAESGPADSIVAGVTGLSRGSAEARDLQEMLRGIFDATGIVVMSDIELAYRAVFQPGSGILVYAGTGSIAAHLTADGELLTAGGKGVLLDDAGGGYWIAVSALRHVLRSEDMAPGSGWTTPLGRELAIELGGNDWPTVRQAIYGADRGAIGMLARPVARAAVAGDTDAIDILHRAGQELGTLALMLENRCGRHPVAVSGRAATLHSAVLDGIRQSVPDRTIVLQSIDAAAGAAGLGADLQFLRVSDETGD